MVRELALRGARELLPDRTVQGISELRRRGVKWPARSLADSLGEIPLGRPDAEDSYRGSRALDDVREDRV